MTYEDVLERVNGKLRFGTKPGLDRIQRVLTQLGNPERELKFVHVAGTNGKGSCCTLLSSVLIESGYKTGLFTSPYVLDFRERFQIDGEMISKAETAQMATEVLQAVQLTERDGDFVTEFEFITAMAFFWFRQKGCDIVVLEVGLGGRLDTTNVISVPEAAVIMSVSLDHTAILGDSLEQIAGEKAGIIKKNGTVVLYPEQDPVVQQVLEDACSAMEASRKIPQLEAIERLKCDIFGTAFRYRGIALRTPFLGTHQVKNAVTAYETIDVLRKKGFQITDAQIAEGMRKARIPARMEILSAQPLILLDGGHNPGCALALAQAMKVHMQDKKRIGVIGMMRDKDYDTYLRIVAPQFERLITVAPDMPRALPAEELAECAAKYIKHVHSAANISQAVQELNRFCAEGSNHAAVICGSFFLASEIRPCIIMEKNA